MVVTTVASDELMKRIAKLRTVLSTDELVSRIWPLIEAQLDEAGHSTPEEMVAAKQACACLLEHLAAGLEMSTL